MTTEPHCRHRPNATLGATHPELNAPGRYKQNYPSSTINGTGYANEVGDVDTWGEYWNDKLVPIYLVPLIFPLLNLKVWWMPPKRETVNLV